MNLKDIWDKQEEQNKYWLKNRVEELTEEEIEERTIKHAMACITNLSKLVGETNWRMHILEKNEVVKDNILEHGIDVFKQLISLLQLYSFTHEDFIIMFDNKTSVMDNYNKHQAKRLGSTDRIIGLDLDGVIFNFRDEIQRFYQTNGFKPKPIPIKQYHIWKDMEGMTIGDCENLRTAFIADGGFARLQLLNDNIPDLISYLREKLNYTIVLVTARPISRFRRLYFDTLNSLKRCGIKYDYLKWGKDKAEILESFHPAKVHYFVEDVMKHAVELAQIGIKVLLVNKTYNLTVDVRSSNIVRVTNFDEVVDFIAKELV